MHAQTNVHWPPKTRSQPQSEPPWLWMVDQWASIVSKTLNFCESAPKWTGLATSSHSTTTRNLTIWQRVSQVAVDIGWDNLDPGEKRAKPFSNIGPRQWGSLVLFFRRVSFRCC